MVAIFLGLKLDRSPQFDIISQQPSEINGNKFKPKLLKNKQTKKLKAIQQKWKKT